MKTRKAWNVTRKRNHLLTEESDLRGVLARRADEIAALVKQEVERQLALEEQRALIASLDAELEARRRTLRGIEESSLPMDIERLRVEEEKDLKQIRDIESSLERMAPEIRGAEAQFDRITEAKIRRAAEIENKPSSRVLRFFGIETESPLGQWLRSSDAMCNETLADLRRMRGGRDITSEDRATVSESTAFTTLAEKLAERWREKRRARAFSRERGRR